jgi:hypothetical protein
MRPLDPVVLVAVEALGVAAEIAGVCLLGHVGCLKLGRECAGGGQGMGKLLGYGSLCEDLMDWLKLWCRD